MKPFRIGCIGAGAVAQNCHIPGYAASRRCRLVAVADPVARCLRDLKKLGFHFERTYSDYRQMLKREQLDAVSICTPNCSHREIATACARKGWDILLEKPVAITIPEANAIRRAVVKHKARLMVGFTHRFNDFNIKARNALKAGKIGKPYMIRIRFAHTGPAPGWAKTDWFYNPKLSGGGAMLDMAVHAFDLLNWYIGPVKTVQSVAATLRKKIKVDDNAVIVVAFQSKCLGYVEVGWTSPAGFCGIELMGDKGAIVVDYGVGKVTMTTGVRKPSGEAIQKTTVLAKSLKVGPWEAEMRHFISRLGRKGKFATNIEDGIAAQKIAVAAYKSHETGKRVSIR